MLRHAHVPQLGLIVAVIALSIGFFSGGRADATEPIAWAGVVFFLVTQAEVRAMFKGLPRPHRHIALLLLLAALAGQLADKSRVLFPFAAWTMYTRPVSNVDRGTAILVLEAETGAGGHFEVDLQSLYGPLTHGIFRQLHNLARRVQPGGTDEEDPAAVPHLEAWVQAIGRTANAQPPGNGDPIEAITLRRAWLPFGTDPETGAMRFDDIARVPIQ